MGDRDAWWTTGLHALWGQKGAIDRLIQWADRLWPHDEIEAESAELTAIAIAWLLTSSNRYLRDHATKSLVRVLTWKPELAANMVAKFAQLDDAYVAERVLAAVFGASMRTTDVAGVELVADAVYAQVFAAGDPRSNFDAGEHPEIYTSIHGEASVVAQAARDGVSLKGAEIYVTTFPCANCARLIAEVGIKKVYYRDGYSMLDAEDIFKAANIEVVLVQEGSK